MIIVEESLSKVEHYLYKLIEEAHSARGIPSEAMNLCRNSRIDSLALDSLKLIEIVFQLETKFSLVADENLLSNIVTLGDILGLLKVVKT